MVRPSGSEIRRLIELREMIKVESLRLPTARQRDLLGLLERARPWKMAPSPVPEIPLQGAKDAARFIERARRRKR